MNYFRANSRNDHISCVVLSWEVLRLVVLCIANLGEDDELYHGGNINDDDLLFLLLGT